MYVPTTRKEREALERNRSLQQLQRKNALSFFTLIYTIFYYVSSMITVHRTYGDDAYYEQYQ